MNVETLIESPYVPTASQLREAVPFTNFDSELFVEADPVASDVLNKKYFKVTKSFRFYFSADRPNVWGYVPAGFLTDGASVPRPFWWVVPPWGRHGQAAVLHDILCETLTMFKDELPYRISRKEADRAFYDAMKATQVNVLLRNIMYWAVRAWSVLGWRTSKAEQARKRAIEVEYMREYGTHREPTAILRQVRTALLTASKLRQEI